MVRDYSRHGVHPTAKTPVRLVRMRDQVARGQHMHDWLELVIILGGSGEHSTDDGSWPVQVGDVFVIDPCIPHAYHNCDKLHLMNVLLFPLEYWLPNSDIARQPGYHALFALEPRLRSEHAFGSRMHLRGSQRRTVFALLNEMECVQYREDPGFGFGLTYRGMQLIELLVRAYDDVDRVSVERREVLRLADVLGFIERHLDRSISLDELVTCSGMSKTSLLRTFHQAVGSTPIDYVLRRRIERACDILRDEHNSITDAAFAVGFNDSNYFTRQFRRVMGVTPSVWRKALI